MKLSFWFGLFLIWMAHLQVDFMLGVWPIYKTLVELDLVVAGWIVSLGIFFGEGAQLYFGLLSDKGHGKKLLLLGLVLISTIPLLSYVEKEWVLFLFVLSAYVGSGAFHPAAVGLVMVGPTQYRSTLLALFASGGMVGAATSQIIYKMIHNNYNGATAFLIIPILFLLAFCLWFKFPVKQAQKEPLKLAQIWEKIKPFRKELTLLYCIELCLQIVLFAFTFLLPDILKIKGYEEWFCFGGGYFCFILGGVITSIPTGYLVDKIGCRAILMMISLIGLTALLSFLTINTLSVVTPALLLFVIGGSLGVVVSVVLSGAASLVSSDVQSFVSAIYMGGVSCLAGFGPVLAGIIASYFEEGAAISAIQILSCFLVIGLILSYYVTDRGNVTAGSLAMNLDSTATAEV